MSAKRQPHILLHAAEKIGGLASLARELGITKQAINQWTKVPAERVVEIERVTGVSRQELRPDLYATSNPLSGAA